MKKIIAVASGKGGVGKSTIATNLAVALANNPIKESKAPSVCLIDVDFYGPSIPTLMGGGEIKVDHQEKFIPASKFNVKYISIAFFLKNPDDPIVWRGPMFGKAINQLFNDVSWGDVDICVVDMPPGTGDAQISLSQMVKLDGAVIVTTPQEVALTDVRRAVNMFAKVNVPVLGVIENMTGEMFGSGGGEALAKQYDLSFLGSLPLDVTIRKGGDTGTPVAFDTESQYGKLFADIATATLKEVDAANAGAQKLKVVN